ncbi:MAG: hypothetical protein Q7I99_03815 [Acholeplasmataceae bacterium]|nr:hypothetical protein [Acholeplasmataceae bacterium]
MLIDIIKNITDKVKNSSVSFIDMNLLTNNSWFLITEEVLNSKKIYIFKSNGQLLISINGDVIKGSWEILLHATNSLLIEHQDKSEMFNVSFLTNDFLILQKDGTESFTAFVKQEKYNAGVSLNGELKHYENMLSDLKEILNAPNHSTSGVKKISAIPKNERKNEKIFLETQTKEIDLDKMSLTLSESGLYYIFDEFKELENRKINGEIITSDDEIDFLVSVQLLKDELFQSNELCPK